EILIDGRGCGPLRGRWHADAHVLGDGHVGEDLSLLGYIGDAGTSDAEGALTGNVLALENDAPAGRLHEAHDGFQCRGAAGAVAAKQAHDLTLPDFHGYAMQDMALLVVSVQSVDLEQGYIQCTSSPR